MAYHEKFNTTIKEIVNYYSDKINEEDIAVDVKELHCRCWHCGDKSKLYRCHIIPSSADGQDIPSNYVLLCRRCHEEAPNCTNPIIMWDWLKRDCSQIYDYYWGTNIIRLYNIMYDNKFFEDYTIRYKLNNKLLSKIIMSQFDNIKLHIGSGHFNESTWVGLFKMAFIEFDKYNKNKDTY